MEKKKTLKTKQKQQQHSLYRKQQEQYQKLPP